MPVYLVKDKETGGERLVSASRPAIALRHVTTPRFTVEQADGMDMFRLGAAGAIIENADDAPEAAAPAVEPPADGPQEQDAAPLPTGWSMAEVEQVVASDDDDRPTISIGSDADDDFPI